MNIKDIVLITLVFCVLYLIYKTRNLEKLSNDLPNIETFETNIENGINNKYNIDIDAMRNLSQVAHYILKNEESFTIPANNTFFNNVVIDGSIMGINKDKSFINILPKYMVIQWASTEIPLGWVLCDGKRYSLGQTGKVYENTLGDLTPDLRGRFILSSGIGRNNDDTKDLTERLFNKKGGEEKHELLLEEIPSHTHNLHVYGDPNGRPVTEGGNTIKLTDRQTTRYRSENNTGTRDYNKDRPPVEIKKSGGVIKPYTGKIRDGADKDYPDKSELTTTPHNKMPPFVVLIYIMKL
jgi:microcystin-dependent protein